MKRCLRLCLLGMLACGNPVQPPPPFQVAIGQRVLSHRFNTETQREECRFTIASVASGGEVGDFATWQGYDREFRCVSGLIETDVISATDAVANFWGTDHIVTGGTLTANRIASHPDQKFTLAYVFRFIVPSGEQQHSDSVFVDCR